MFVLVSLFLLAACSSGSSSSSSADVDAGTRDRGRTTRDLSDDPPRRGDRSVGDISGELTPVYVTFAGHIEDSRAYADCREYPGFREDLLAFADAIYDTGIPFNLQIDFNFLRGVEACEDPTMQESTEGLSLLIYLERRRNFEIDPHEEGGWEDGVENYADVRYLGGLVTDDITDTVGGVVWDFPDQFAALTAGEAGKIYPDFTWLPEIITLAVYSEHHHGDFSQDDLASGIWLPAGANDNFWVHDDGGRLIYVAPGHQHSNWAGSRDCYFQNGADYVETLAEYLEEGTIATGKIYTSTIAVPQSVIFNADEHQKLIDIIEQLQPLVDEGKVEILHFTDVVDVWETEYDSEPNIFRFDQVDPADYTCN